MKKKLLVMITVFVLVVSTLSVFGVKAGSYKEINDAAALTQSGLFKLGKDLKISTETLVIAKGKEVNLDLNGNTLSLEVEFNSIENNGKLIIKDSSPSKTGKITSKSIWAILNNGELVVNSGNFESTITGGQVELTNDKGKVATESYNSRIIQSYGKLTINGGVFNAAGGVINAREGSETLINNGEMNSTSSNANAPYWCYSVINAGKMIVKNAKITGIQGALSGSAGELTVYDGDFSTDWSNKKSFYALYAAGEVGVAKTVIYGGRYSSPRKAAYIGNDNTNGDGGINADSYVQIYGGTFIGKENAINLEHNTVKDPKILGGTYLKGNTEKDATAELSEYMIPSLDSKFAFYDSNTGEVKAKVTSIDLIKKATINAGENLILISKVLPDYAYDKTITWASEDTSIAIVDNAGKVTAKKAGTTKITAKIDNIFAICDVTVYQIDSVQPPRVDIEKPTNEVKVGINDKESNQTINSTVNEILNGNAGSLVSSDTQAKIETAIQNGKVITTTVVSETVSENALEKGVVDSFKDEAKKLISKNEKIVIAQYLDLSIGLMAGTEKLGEVNQLTNKIQFTIAMPNDLVKNGRTYYILRMHEGEITKLPVNVEGNILKFYTDRFSTYALVYVEDINIPEIDKTLELPSKPVIAEINRPAVQTSDMSNVTLWFAVITLSFVSLIIFSKKTNIIANK